MMFVELICIVCAGVYIYGKTFYKKQEENRQAGYSPYTSDRLATNIAFCKAFMVCLLLLLFCLGR